MYAPLLRVSNNFDPAVAMQLMDVQVRLSKEINQLLDNFTRLGEVREEFRKTALSSRAEITKRGLNAPAAANPAPVRENRYRYTVQLLLEGGELRATDLKYQGYLVRSFLFLILRCIFLKS